MSYELFLGMKYLMAKRKKGFLSIITLISLVGVMVGVMALIVVMSVMNGFHADIMTKKIGVDAHIRVTGQITGHDKVIDDLVSLDGVLAATPFIHSQVMVKSHGAVSGPVLRGLDTESVGKVSNIESMIEKGTLSDLDNIHDGLPGIIIGKELAGFMGVASGDDIEVISPQGRLTPLGRVAHTLVFRIVGLFNSGWAEYDSLLTFISLKEAQHFLGTGDYVSGIEIRVDDVNRAAAIAETIRKKLKDPYRVQDWKAMNLSLWSAMKLEKLALFVILTMIILVGALNIISTLVMAVMEKTRAVAILRAMGATSGSIMKVFMFQGITVGLLGTLAGLFSGLGICYLISEYIHIDMPTDFYGLSTLPVRVEVPDLVLVTLAAFMVSFLATIYPSWYASRLRPIEALRYE